MVDKNKKSPNNTFKFEDKTKFGGGDHCAPNDNLYKTKTPTINPNIFKMYNNYQDRYENPEEKAEHELRSILKKDPEVYKSLLEFTKKYKYFNISSYLNHINIRNEETNKKLNQK